MPAKRWLKCLVCLNLRANWFLLVQIPIAKGVPRKGAAEFGSPLTFLTPTLEVNVGRIAMLVRSPLYSSHLWIAQE